MTEPAEPRDGAPAADASREDPVAVTPEIDAPATDAPASHATADEAPEPSGLAWAITTRLNRFTRKFLGPAQVGERAPDTQVPSTLPGTPCSVCGKPLSEHELVRTTDAKMRLYCPGSDGGRVAP